MRPAVLIFVTLASFAAAARAGEVVPAKSGYPALTQEMLDRGSAFVEWAMGVRFTPAQRARQQGFVIDHGSYTTVVAKLGSLDVPVGAAVQQGDRLGTAARYRVYVEVRAKVRPGGLPIDPAPLLR